MRPADPPVVDDGQPGEILGQVEALEGDGLGVHAPLLLSVRILSKSTTIGCTMLLVLVSSCLLGEPVRYNGGAKKCEDEVLQRWFCERRIVPVCPELAGGMPVPRPPAEIANGGSGMEVLDGTAKVMDETGCDVSANFVTGAEKIVESAISMGIRLAVMKEGSPSCGTGYTYDGTFTGVKVPNFGVTAAKLRQACIYVFSETQFAEADSLLNQLEMGALT